MRIDYEFPFYEAEEIQNGLFVVVVAVALMTLLRIRICRFCDCDDKQESLLPVRSECLHTTRGHPEFPIALQEGSDNRKPLNGMMGEMAC